MKLELENHDYANEFQETLKTLNKEIDDHIQNLKKRIDRVIEIGLLSKIKEVS